MLFIYSDFNLSNDPASKDQKHVILSELTCTIFSYLTVQLSLHCKSPKQHKISYANEFFESLNKNRVYLSTVNVFFIPDNKEAYETHLTGKL